MTSRDDMITEIKISLENCKISQKLIQHWRNKIEQIFIEKRENALIDSQLLQIYNCINRSDGELLQLTNTMMALFNQLDIKFLNISKPNVIE